MDSIFQILNMKSAEPLGDPNVESAEHFRVNELEREALFNNEVWLVSHDLISQHPRGDARNMLLHLYWVLVEPHRVHLKNALQQLMRQSSLSRPLVLRGLGHLFREGDGR